MRRPAAAAALCTLADGLGVLAGGSTWYLFGSVDREEPGAADIDLLILCRDADQADRLRTAIDPDMLGLPLDLSLMTYDEAKEAKAVERQRARKIYPEAARPGSTDGINCCHIRHPDAEAPRARGSGGGGAGDT